VTTNVTVTPGTFLHETNHGCTVDTHVRSCKLSLCQENNLSKQWRNWGAEGRAAPPGKLNVKSGPPLPNILIFSNLLVFSRLLLFLRFSGCFRCFLGSIEIHDIRIHYHFLIFFLRIGYSGPLQLRFAPPDLNL